MMQRGFEQKKAEQEISPELTGLAQLTAKKILENVEEAQKQQVALSHENISIEKRHLLNEAAVFFMRIGCRNGRRMTRKNFSKPPISMKVKAIAVIWRLNLPCLTS